MPTLPRIDLLAGGLDDPAWRELSADVLGVLVTAADGDDVGEAAPAAGAEAVADGTAVTDGGTSADAPTRPPLGAEKASSIYGVDLAAEAARQRIGAPAGSSAVVRLPRLTAGVAPWDGLPETVAVIAAGDGGPAAARKIGLALGRAAAGTSTAVLPVPAGTDAATVQALAEGFLLASFRMPRTARKPDGKPPAERLVLLGAAGNEAAVERAVAGVGATLLTRVLAATPSSTKNPEWLAEQARALATEVAGDAGGTTTGSRPAGRLEVEVRDEAWLAEHGMGGIVAVGSASATPPRLVTVRWEPAVRAPGAPTVALVGKGITFDTGGISIKPRESMVPMKTDMAGAAAVLAAVLGAARLGLGVPVTAVLPLAENAIGASAYRPGDVVRTYDGTTVEISNTDAEGRMVLADALAWAIETYDPDVVVDVATLTGAATLGLGRGHAALYATDETLAAGLLEAAERTGEAAWRMPLVDDYRPALDSDIADVAHMATDPHVNGGSIVAALFLERFVAGRPWAHLDIAGVGRTGSAQGELPANGPTGYGARLLVDYLAALAG